MPALVARRFEFYYFGFCQFCAIFLFLDDGTHVDAKKCDRDKKYDISVGRCVSGVRILTGLCWMG